MLELEQYRIVGTGQKTTGINQRNLPDPSLWMIQNLHTDAFVFGPVATPNDENLNCSLIYVNCQGTNMGGYTISRETASGFGYAIVLSLVNE
jgi:hypothetical protein